MIWVSIVYIYIYICIYIYILKIADNAHIWLYSYASLYANDCKEFITVLTSNKSPFKAKSTI